MTGLPTSAFVTGGSGFIGGRLIERLVGGGCAVRALARSDRSAAAVEATRRRGGAGDLADAGGDGGRRGRLRARLPPRRPPRRHGERARSSCAATSTAPRTRSRPRAAPACAASSTAAPRRPCWPVSRWSNVDETAPLRPDSKALYSATKAHGRAGRPRRERRGLRDRRAAPAPRLGRRRHDAAARDGRRGRGRQVRLDRRRPPTHRHHPRRQRRRGPRCSPPRRAAAARPTSSPTASRSSSATSSPRCSRRRASRRRPARFPAGVAARWRRGRRRVWRLLPLGGEPPLHPPRLLALVAGVHDRHLQGAARARLRAGQGAVGGPRGAACRSRIGGVVDA